MTFFTDTEKVFEEARKIYPGIKRGFKTEFGNFKKKHKDFESVVELLKPAIIKQKNYREANKNGFIPEWKHLQTWINNRCWEEEMPMVQNEMKFSDPLILGQGEQEWKKVIREAEEQGKWDSKL